MRTSALHCTVAAARALLEELMQAHAVELGRLGGASGRVVAGPEQTAVVAPLHAEGAAAAREVLERLHGDDLLDVGARQTSRFAGADGRRLGVHAGDDTLDVLGAEHGAEAGATGGVPGARDEAGQRQQVLAGRTDDEPLTVSAGHAVGQHGLSRVALEADEIASVLDLDPLRAERQA